MTEVSFTIQKPNWKAWSRPTFAVLCALIGGLALWGILQLLTNDATEEPVLWSIFLGVGAISVALGAYHQRMAWLIGGAVLLTFPALTIGNITVGWLAWVGLLAPLVGLHPTVDHRGRATLLFVMLLAATGVDAATASPGILLYGVAFLYVGLYAWAERDAPKLRRVALPALAFLAILWSTIA